MPAFGTNPNVACYMDDIYVYLRARANDASGARAPPSTKTSPKPIPRRKTPAWARNELQAIQRGDLRN